MSEDNCLNCIFFDKNNRMKNNNYPKVIYGYAILLDNKIENWAVRTINRRYIWEFKGCWKKGRLQDYKMQKVCWVCNNEEECAKVFEELAPKWFRNWKHADDFILQKAY